MTAAPVSKSELLRDMIRGTHPRSAVALMSHGFAHPLAIELIRQMDAGVGDATALMGVGVSGADAERLAAAITGAH